MLTCKLVEVLEASGIEVVEEVVYYIVMENRALGSVYIAEENEPFGGNCGHYNSVMNTQDEQEAIEYMNELNAYYDRIEANRRG